MSLNFPNNPALNEIADPGSGINYQWDGEKWVIYVAPGSGVNLWQRDTTGDPILKPLNNGDDFSIVDVSDTATFIVDAETGDVTTSGQVIFDHLDIEGLTLLP